MTVRAMLPLLWRGLGVALLIVGFAGCDFEDLQPPTAQPISSENCAPVAPSFLPDGSPAGEGETVRGSDGDRVTWGRSDQVVTQVVGAFPVVEPETEKLPEGHPQAVQIRGHDAIVMPVGDENTGQIVLAWTQDGCDYTVWLAPGVGLDEAISYASNY